MIERRFAPGFRVRHQQKDLNLALHTARSLGIALPATALAQELFNAVASQNGSDLDHSALVLALEKLAGHEVSCTIASKVS
jgi:2-hydroxy-3-oxopropionate reductase